MEYNLKIKDIIKCTKGKLIIGNPKSECINFSKDTRTIQKGDTYIGIKGEKYDGSQFWEEAFEKGAETVIIEKIKIEEEKKEKYKNEGKAIIEVENTKEALKQMAIQKRNIYGNNLKVVGITGSVGKTSTKDMVASVLRQKYKTIKTEGNNNNDIGLPLTILRIKDEQVAVIEMGMNHFGEISELTKIAKPDLAVITNIGSSHIGNLGSRENILKAKLEILEGMERKHVVINNDNDLLHEWAKKEKIEIDTYGINNKSDAMAENIEYFEQSSKYTCNLKGEKFEIEVPVGGEHFVLNALCASLVGKEFNLNNEEIKRGIEEFKLTKKRMEIINLKNGVKIINDSYNASFESMETSIKYLSNIKNGRKIAVLGDMFELGKFSEELHKKVGQQVAKNKIDKLIVVGKDAKYIMQEAQKNGMKKEQIEYFNTQEETKENIIKNMQSGDIILFKASNGMKLFNIVEDIKNKIGLK